MAYSVIVIDDSALMRQVLTDYINQLDNFHVIATAVDPYDAREKIKQHNPDIITVDINMPKMDGVTFLENLKRLRPTPSIVVSSESDKRNSAIANGAIDFVAKTRDSEPKDAFLTRIKTAFQKAHYILEKNRIKNIDFSKRTESTSQYFEAERKVHPDEFLPSTPAKFPGKKIVAIGASTGGVEALTKIFTMLKAGRPPIVITQHIPYGFSGSFATRLGTVGPIKSKEAMDGDLLLPDHAYVAPGNAHLLIEKRGDNYYAKVVDGTKVSRHKPSVDVLFRSVNNEAGAGALAVILTGMGDDGSIGIKDLFNSGATTLAQDEKSCVVFGMPKRAIENGAVKQILNLEEIANYINSF